MLQSKKVKLVATKSGPFSTLTDNLLVKWDSPLGMIGSRSFLTKVTLVIIITDNVLRQWRS